MNDLNINMKWTRVTRLILLALLFVELIICIQTIDGFSYKKQYVIKGIVEVKQLLRNRRTPTGTKQIIINTSQGEMHFVCVYPSRRISCFENDVLNQINNQEVIAIWQKRNFFYPQLISIELKNGTTYKVKKEYYFRTKKQVIGSYILRYCLYILILLPMYFMIKKLFFKLNNHAEKK